MRRITAFLIPFAVLALAASSVACPMCKDSISDTAAAARQYGSGGMDAGLPSGFNNSVYIMLISVFSMMALVIGIIAKGIRSASATTKPGFPTVHVCKSPD